MFQPGDRVLLKVPLKGKRRTAGRIIKKVPESDFYYVMIKYQVWSISESGLVIEQSSRGNGEAIRDEGIRLDSSDFQDRCHVG